MKGAGRIEHVVDHRLSGHAVERLRLKGLHPGALAGGENRDVHVSHAS